MTSQVSIASYEHFLFFITIHIFLHLILRKIHKLNKEISLTHEEIQLDGPRQNLVSIHLDIVVREVNIVSPLTH